MSRFLAGIRQLPLSWALAIFFYSHSLTVQTSELTDLASVISELKQLKLNEEHLRQEIKEMKENNVYQRKEIYHLKTRLRQSVNESNHLDDSAVLANSKYVYTCLLYRPGVGYSQSCGDCCIFPSSFFLFLTFSRSPNRLDKM